MTHSDYLFILGGILIGFGIGNIFQIYIRDKYHK